MKPRAIVIDGKTYHSPDEMPPEVRSKYEQAMSALGDANGNQIPDVFETVNILADKDKHGISDVLENIVAGHTATTSLKIVIDGKEFNGIEDLPPEARARYEEAMGKLDANRNGVPDFVEGAINMRTQVANTATGFEMETPRRTASLPTSSMITPDTSNGWMLALAGLFIIFLCLAGAAAIWYLFLR